MSQISKRLLVTGANRGIGYQLVYQIAKMTGVEYDIHFTTRNQQEGFNLLKGLEIRYPHHLFFNIELDLTNQKQLHDYNNFCNENKIVYDVIINNAGVSFPIENPQSAEKNININFKQTIQFAEMMQNHLNPENGKQVFLSSLYGKLRNQRDPLKTILDAGKFDKQEILKIADEYISQMKKDNPDLQGLSHESYSVSKCLLNAYIRHLYRNNLQNNQNAYAVHPGWCQTDMGGKDATLTADKGTKSTLAVIFDLPFQKDDQYNCKFFDENGKVWSW